jgi:transcriptional regulator GlxA family with amidase domain
VVSICTGLYGVAPTGLLDGCRVTTHWQHAADIAARFPALRLEPDALFIKHGKFYSSAGVTAAIDLSLALIEEDFGPALSVAVARALVVYVKRSGGQLQYSEPLQFQAKAGDRFAELASWMVEHLGGDLSVETLAARTGLSVRQFNRRFKQIFQTGPAAHVERLRLDAARTWLTASATGMARIAHETGFSSDDAFRRAFDRRFGLPPAEYRRRFSTVSQGASTDAPIR